MGVATTTLQFNRKVYDQVVNPKKTEGSGKETGAWKGRVEHERKFAWVGPKLQGQVSKYAGNKYGHMRNIGNNWREITNERHFATR